MGLLHNQTGIHLQKASAQENSRGKDEMEECRTFRWGAGGQLPLHTPHHQPAPPLTWGGKAVLGQQESLLEERSTPEIPTERTS